MKQTDMALSPVIGVIFMVIITVVIAATISWFIFGMASDTDRFIGSVSINAANTDGMITLTNNGGRDAPLLERVFVSVNGGRTQEWVGGNYVGATKVLGVSDGIKQTGNRIIVYGEFKSNVWFPDRAILLTAFI